MPNNVESYDESISKGMFNFHTWPHSLQTPTASCKTLPVAMGSRQPCSELCSQACQRSSSKFFQVVQKHNGPTINSPFNIAQTPHCCLSKMLNPCNQMCIPKAIFFCNFIKWANSTSHNSRDSELLLQGSKNAFTNNFSCTKKKNTKRTPKTTTKLLGDYR